jgi:hypothetical protein
MSRQIHVLAVLTLGMPTGQEIGWAQNCSRHGAEEKFLSLPGITPLLFSSEPDVLLRTMLAQQK